MTAARVAWFLVQVFGDESSVGRFFARHVTLVHQARIETTVDERIVVGFDDGSKFEITVKQIDAGVSRW